MSTASTQPPKRTMKDYLRVLFKRKVLFLVPLGAIFLGGLVISLRLPKTYSATARIRRITSGVVTEAAGPNQLAARVWPRMQPQEVRELVLSKRLIDRALKAAGMYVTGDDAYARRERQRITREVIRRTKVGVIYHSKDNDYLHIEHRGPDAVKVAAFTNALADAFVEQTVDTAKQQARTAHNVAKGEAEAAGERYQKLQSRLDEFKKKNRGRLVKNARQVYLEHEEMQRDLDELDQEIRSLKATKEMLVTRLKKMPQQVVKRRRYKENPAYRALVARLETLKAKRDEMLLTRTELHPEVRAADRFIASVNKEMKDTPAEVPDFRDEEINAGVTNVEEKLLAIDAKLDALQVRRDERQEDILRHAKRVDVQWQFDDELSRLEEQARLAGDIYRDERSREGQALRTMKTTLEEQGLALEVWEAAEVPQQPDGPKVTTYAILSLLLGLGLGLGLVFLAEMNDSSFRTYDDATQFLNVPVVGAIAAIETPQERLWRQSRNKVLSIVGLVVGGIVALTLLLVVILSIHDPSFFVHLLEDPVEGITEAFRRVFG